MLTIVPVKLAIEAIKKVTQHIIDEVLPVARNKFIKLITMCINFGPFTFDNDEFEQHNGVPIGSPLSPVATCLYIWKSGRTKSLKKLWVEEQPGSDMLTIY